MRTLVTLTLALAAPAGAVEHGCAPVNGLQRRVPVIYSTTANKSPA
jgi:hypothetical protein